VPHRRLTLRSSQNAGGLTIPRSGSNRLAGRLDRVVAAPLSTRRRAIYAALALLSLFSVALVLDPRAIGMTVLLSGFLTLSYLVVYAFMRFEVLEER
jgi:hypothetical protein